MKTKYLLAGFILGSLVGVYPAQTPKSRRRPVQPSPPVSQELPPVPRILSTAEDQDTGEEPVQPQPRPVSMPAQQSSRTVKTAPPERQARPLRLEDVILEQDAQRRSLNKLSGSVTNLGAKINSLESQQRQTLTLQRLTYTEQRAENMRQQLLDMQNKEIELQRDLEQNESNSRPEAIERATALYGTTHPEEMREQRRVALLKEHERLLAQQEIVRKNRERLEIVVARADQEVEKLRTQLDKESEEAGDNSGPNGQTGTGTEAPPVKPAIRQENPNEP